MTLYHKTLVIFPFRMIPSVAGVCDFPADPQHSALEQPVIWSVFANPAVLMLGTTPDFLSPSPAALSVDIVEVISGPEGSYSVCRDGDSQYLILADTSPDARPAIILPLDGDLPDRLEAILRLWHMLAAKPARRDPRMTPYQRRRFRLMMQAADGNANQATYREIAVAIYGEDRVRAEPWKTSALRASVIALVRSAAALIDGGYHDLLRHRRKP
ncbi:hypothetical protein HNP73_000965 [Amaricoccus macauensis]|uniref:T6SS Transcription factor RovC-like DNA binding domain-containing protein n=2 Tax=Amaricoccus macauensis TaxID=57001 RepID=A0A840SJB8_9RHOB|nr:DUF2285 domain-containing protein [Amaricoccus macauensis]MBB5221044.1 hypothetical protein [Amaricoccus macauensis]